MPRSLTLLALGRVLTAVDATPVRAQGGCECDPYCDQLNVQTLPGMGRVTYVSGARFACEGGIRIVADSAVSYGDRGYSELIGAVRYTEAGRELLSDQARYFTTEGRLQAAGNLILRDEEQGSEIRNGDLVYLLETEFRDASEMTVTTGEDGIRPRALLRPPEREEAVDADSLTAVPPDSLAALPADSLAALPVDSLAARPVDSLAARPVDSLANVVPDSLADAAPTGEESPPDTVPPTPYTVEGDRMFLQGQGFFTAVGDVEIVRDSLFAFGDSAVYDQTRGDLLLEGSARVEGEAYRLVGRTIAMVSPGSAASEVRARREARLDGEGFDLTAAQIAVFLADDALERLVATPIARPDRGEEAADSADLERPEALVQDFVLTADSVEINAPGEVIERVFAAGRARSVSTSRDSLNVDVLPDVARTDWLEGDTVVVTFAPNPGAQSASDVDVEAITAKVRARSLYRLPPSDSTAVPGTDAPAVHYVMGDSIRIEMAAGEVLGMRVTGQTRGVHLEPLRRSTPADTAALADSLGATDTLAVPPDTSGVAADPSRSEGPSSRGDQEREPPSRAPRDARTEERPWIRP
jgi:hypothetical protein